MLQKQFLCRGMIPLLIHAKKSTMIIIIITLANYLGLYLRLMLSTLCLVFSWKVTLHIMDIYFWVDSELHVKGVQYIFQLTVSAFSKLTTLRSNTSHLLPTRTFFTSDDASYAKRFAEL